MSSLTDKEKLVSDLELVYYELCAPKPSIGSCLTMINILIKKLKEENTDETN